jgi:hypothetical protein
MDTPVQPRNKRPKLVWTVFLFYVLSSVYTALSFLLVFSGTIPVTPEQAAYFRSLSTFDWAITALTGLLNVVGAIAIFRLRKIAFHIFAAAFVLVILQTFVHIVTTNFAAALGGSGALGALIGYGILLAVCVYAWKLKARGVLA